MTCSPSTDRQTDTQTHTKVISEGTLSGFQDFFLQPIIKDRPNKPLYIIINENIHLKNHEYVLHLGAVQI